jgi:hypothetical protein
MLMPKIRLMTRLKGERLSKFNPIVPAANNTGELQDQVGCKRTDGGRTDQHQRLQEKNQPGESFGKANRNSSEDKDGRNRDQRRVDENADSLGSDL